MKKRTTAAERRAWEARVPPPVWWALAASGQLLVPVRRPLTAVRVVPAALIAAASLSLGATAIRGFRKAHTTVSPHPLENTTVLVTRGAHGVSRNPMYLALAGPRWLGPIG